MQWQIVGYLTEYKDPVFKQAYVTIQCNLGFNILGVLDLHGGGVFLVIVRPTTVLISKCVIGTNHVT